MSYKNFENNNNAEPVSANPTNSLIYKFEHGERLKAEREAKERQKALFAKKMAKFGEGEQDDKPKSTNAVNQKAKMFVEIANKDPEKERAERERKLEFERKLTKRKHKKPFKINIQAVTPKRFGASNSLNALSSG